MGLKIVTGRTGTPHISSNQIQAFNRSLLGDLAILDLGQHFDAVVRDANTIRIYDGCIVVQGIYAVIPHDEYEDVLVEPVSVGNTRIDTIYLHYAKDMETDTETVELDIAQGEEAVNNPVKPDIDAGGDTWEGTTDIRIPLYDVTVTSFETTIVPYEYMNVYSPTISELQERIPETTVSGVKGDAESEYRSGNVNITPTNIGLGNVDNTADTDKPVSTAQQEALDDKVDKVTGKGLSTNDYTNEEKQKNADNASAIEDIQEDISQPLTATGNPLTIESSESNLVECVAEVECVQEGSGDPSPDNIRPITGQTEVVIEDVGKNLFDTSEIVEGTITNNGDNFENSASKRTNNYIKVTGGSNYIISGLNNTIRLHQYTYNKTYIGNALQSNGNFTVNNNCEYIRIAGNAGWESNILMIRLATETDATYEPYKGKTYRVEIGQKNKLPMTVDGIKSANTSGTWSGNVYTYNGATFEILVDSDNNVIGIKFNSTTNVTHLFNLYSGDVSIFSNMIMNGATDGNDGKFIRFNVGSTNYDDRGAGVNIGTVSGTGSIYIALYNQKSGIFYPMIRSTIDDSEFVPYNPNLPEAIYGGELDVVTGELTVTHGEVDLGDLNYGYTNGYFYSPTINTLIEKPSDNSEPANVICSSYETKAVTERTDGSICVNTGGTVVITDSRYTDATAFKTAVTGQTLVYELATPYTIQLTPQQIKLLKGTNNISCNTGDLTIKYYPDNVLGQLKGDIEKGLNAYYDYQIKALWDKIGELQA